MNKVSLGWVAAYKANEAFPQPMHQRLAGHSARTIYGSLKKAIASQRSGDYRTEEYVQAHYDFHEVFVEVQSA